MTGEQSPGLPRALPENDAEALFERAPCGYVLTTADGLITRVNETFLTWSGYRRSDLVGHLRFSDLLTAGGRIYNETHYVPMLRLRGNVEEIALDIVAADGRRLPALLSSVLEGPSDGEPEVIRTVIIGAAERRGYERELLRAKQRAEESEAQAAALARTLQQTLMPPAPPRVPGLEVDAVYRAAGEGDEVGGDFYDVFEVAEGDLVVVVGDVCGKGIDAAIVSAVARHTIRAAAVRHPELAQVLDTLNEVLVRHDTDRYCTLSLVRLRSSGGTWTATISSAGHPLPLLAREGVEPAELGQPGPLVGVEPDRTFSDSDVTLRPGDALVLYTDGVTEGRSGKDFFGSERLEAAVTAHSASASSLTSGILRDVLAFQAGTPRDDIVILAVRVPPPSGRGATGGPS